MAEDTDPKASFIADAFSVDWSKFHLYAFSPLSLIGRCLDTIQACKAEGLLVVLAQSDLLSQAVEIFVGSPSAGNPEEDTPDPTRNSQASPLRKAESV